MGASACSVVGLQKEQYEGVFTVEDFLVARSLTKKGQSVNSPELANVAGCGLQLCIYPHGCDQATEDNTISLFLMRDRKPHATSNAIVNLAVTILGQDGNAAKELTYADLWRLSEDKFQENGWLNFWTWSECQQRGLVKGNLRIQWKITAYIGGYQVKSASQGGFPTLEALTTDWARIFSSGASADLEIVSRDRQTRNAHKAVLVARSEVFSRMFASDMREASTNRIDIADADGDTVFAFLHFLYVGHLPQSERNIGDVTRDLLPLAKKYEVTSLIDFCVWKLVSTIDASNAADLLRLADMWDIAHFKRKVLEFITRSSETMRDVQDTEGFDRLDKDLTKEILVVWTGKRTPKRPREEGALEFPCGSQWSNLTLVQLRRACSERGLSTTGTKAVLQTRLAE